VVAVSQECVDGHIKILKNCLRWRFIVPKGWWLKSDYNISLTVCNIDDQIRDIFYDNGFKLEDELLKEMTSNFKSGCLVNYRKACEKLISGILQNYLLVVPLIKTITSYFSSRLENPPI
jgi:hypothetical protein